MDGYDDNTYGDAFADVYDEWYQSISNVDTTVETLLELAGTGPVLELGVGTGRLAVPLATSGRHRGVTISGIDTSQAMLERLADRDPERLVAATLASMVGPLPAGSFSLVFVAYNTLFNLTTASEQAACFAAVASVLDDHGRFVVEAFVPDDARVAGSDVSVRSLAADRVVLSISVEHPGDQTVEGQFVEFTEHGGVRLRPWSIRYAPPAELDRLAVAAGFELEHRWSSFGRDPFDEHADRHVTVYRKT